MVIITPDQQASALELDGSSVQVIALTLIHLESENT